MAAPIVDDAIPYDAVWDCVTCGACVEACPVLIEHVDKIVGLRRNLVLEESRFPAELDRRVPGHGGPGQPVGPAAVDPDRLDEGPAVRGPDGRRRWPPTGGSTSSRSCTGSAARRRSTSATGGSRGPSRRASTRPAIRFAILGQEESCTGDPARRMGNDYVFQILASGQRRDAEPLRDGGADDRHGLPALLQHDRQRVRPARRLVPRSIHHSVYLQGLLADGRLRVARRRRGGGRRSVTLHDSCYLTRYNGVVDGAARRPRLRARARAARDGEAAARTRSAAAPAAAGCGWRRRAARGSTPSGRVRRSRPAPTTVATECPFCMTMLKDGLGPTPSRGTRRRRVSAIDIAELLADSLAPTQPGGRAAAGAPVATARQRRVAAEAPAPAALRRVPARAGTGDARRPGGDLRPPRDAELREDVLDVGARGLRRDRRARSAISAFVRPSAISRATSNSRAVSGRQGSSIEPRPRLVRASSSARARSGGLPEAVGRRADRRDQRRGLAVAVHRIRQWARSSRAQVASQTRPRSSQPRTARSSASRAADSEPGGEPERPSAWSSAGPATASQPARCSRTRADPALGVVRPARREVRPGAGDDERDEERALAGRRPRSSSASSQRAIAASASPASEVGLGEAPERRQDELRPRRSGGPLVERLLEPAAGLVEPAAAERDEADDVERADDAAPAAAIDELLAGALVGGVPVGRRPSRGARSSSPSSGGSATARSRRRTASLRARASLGGSRVHDPGGHDREVPVAGDADRLEAGVARLARSPHPVARGPVS